MEYIPFSCGRSGNLVHKDASSQAASPDELIALDGHIILHEHDANITPLSLGLLRSQTEVELIARVVLGNEENAVSRRSVSKWEAFSDQR